MQTIHNWPRHHPLQSRRKNTIPQTSQATRKYKKLPLFLVSPIVKLCQGHKGYDKNLSEPSYHPPHQERGLMKLSTNASTKTISKPKKGIKRTIFQTTFTGTPSTINERITFQIPKLKPMSSHFTKVHSFCFLFLIGTRVHSFGANKLGNPSTHIISFFHYPASKQPLTQYL